MRPLRGKCEPYKIISIWHEEHTRSSDSHRRQRICVESAVGAVALRLRWNIWPIESSHWSIVWRPIDEAERLLSTV